MSERKIKIEEAGGTRDNRDAAWDQFVNRHVQGTLFHRIAWKEAVRSSFGHRPRYLIARDAGEIAGLLPLFEIKSIFAGRFLLSVPYATYGGVLADDQEIAELLLGRAREMAIDSGAQCIELRSVHAADDRTDVRNTHATFRRELPPVADEVLSMLPRKTRAAARRAAERYELRVEYGPQYLKTVWRLYARSMRRLGSPNYPFRFFSALAQEFGADHCVQLISHKGQPVAGLITFFHQQTALPYFVGIDERADIYGLNNFLYWQSMRSAVERGCNVYDFGRTRVDNTGSFEFKRSFGFEPQPLEYQTIVPPGGAVPDLSPTSSRWAAARRIWKALPLPLTRPLGAWLARSIPG